MQTIIALHRRATDAVLPLVATVRVEDLDRPTPCAGWTLRDLLRHMIGQDHGFAAAVRRDVDAGAFAPRDWTGVPAAAHAAGIADVLTAFAAADPDRTVLQPEFGGRRFPLDAVVGFHLLDTLVHGWDVAAALGLPTGYDPDLVAAVRRQAALVPDGLARSAPGAPFGPVFTAGAGDDWARTLALLGRDPEWSP